MLDAMVAYLWPEGMTGYTFVGREVQASRAQIAQDLIFETTDGYITAGAVSDAEWLGMCTALERLEWLDDERFKTAAGRVVYAHGTARDDRRGALKRAPARSGWNGSIAKACRARRCCRAKK